MSVACQNDRKDEYISPTTDHKIAGTFVGSQTCVSCHQQEYQGWEGSHHDLAMKVADSSTVLGNFNNVKFTSNNITTHFFKKDNEYYVNTEGPDGKYHDYKVEYTFGVTPLQQYLVKFPKGQYQALLTAWDSEKNKWFALQEELKIQHTEWLHWSGGAMRWNTMCADCHSTNLHKNYDPETEEYNTEFSEINVSCEACHGPASEHVEYYKKSEQDGPPPHLYMNTEMASTEVVDKCARCHSRRSQLTKFFNYEGHFLDNYDPELLTYPTYELDGQIKDEDYVYASFRQSKMYHSGVSCIDCHDVHTTKTRKTGNDLCLRCHDSKYNEPSHHFHKDGTEASLCVNCHMTGKTYMGNDFRRDHSFRIPRPDQTVDYGTPNACNSCHQDKSAEWASQVIKDKFGEERSEHFSDYLIPGQLGDYDALKHLIQDKSFPSIVRATAIREFSNRPLSQEEIELLKRQAQDSSALVRNEVVRALSNFPQPELTSYINELLSDSIRLVRINSARYFKMDENIAAPNQQAFNKANKEYKEYLEMNSDFPSGQQQIALQYEAEGNINKAIDAYRKAIKWDDHNNISRMNLALLLYKQGNINEAENLYLKVIEQEPEFAESYYMLGLLYNETGKKEKSLEFLAKACGMETPLLRACYNYALLLQQNGEFKTSIEVLNKALEHFPDEESLLYVRLISEIQLQENGKALNTINQLIRIAPGNQRYQEIRRNLL